MKRSRFELARDRIRLPDLTEEEEALLAKVTPRRRRAWLSKRAKAYRRYSRHRVLDRPPEAPAGYALEAIGPP